MLPWLTGLLLGPSGTRIARGVLIAALAATVGLGVWRYQSAVADAAAARAERDAAIAARAAVEAREQALQIALEVARREREAAIAARQAADRQLTAQLTETRRLLADVRSARARAAQERRELTQEEATECRAIVEAYRRILEGARP